MFALLLLLDMYGAENGWPQFFWKMIQEKSFSFFCSFSGKEKEVVVNTYPSRTFFSLSILFFSRLHLV